MSDNFNLKKFLVENKLTPNSKELGETTATESSSPDETYFDGGTPLEKLRSTALKYLRSKGLQTSEQVIAFKQTSSPTNRYDEVFRGTVSELVDEIADEAETDDNETYPGLGVVREGGVGFDEDVSYFGDKKPDSSTTLADLKGTNEYTPVAVVNFTSDYDFYIYRMPRA